MLERSYQHLSRCSGLYLWLLVGFITLGRHFIVTLNVSASLPGSVFLIQNYMAAPHPDSLDSRYAWVGWVSDAQIVGRAWTVF